MTDQQRRQINEGIARAMGWDFIPHPSEIVNALEPDRGEWYTPLGKIYGDEPPDFTHDAAASREMVRWLKTQDDDVRGLFLNRLAKLAVPDWDGTQRTWEREGQRLIMQFLTAPLETIAQAAFQAIIQEKS